MAIQLPYTGVTTTETIPAPYTNGLAAIDLNLKEDKANKGIANGYAPLDGGALLPTVNLPSHTHTIANVTGLQTAIDGKQASGSYAPSTGIAPSAITGTAVVTADSRLSDPRTPTSHVHGNITNAGAVGATANLPLITTTSGVVTAGSFGTSANTFVQGNDSRIVNIAGGSINTSNGGGSINVSGGVNYPNPEEIDSGNGLGATGGSIDLRGGNGGQDGSSGVGGSIQMKGASGADGMGGAGGSILMNGSIHDGYSGSINLSATPNASGGSINLSAGASGQYYSGAGGSIQSIGGVTIDDGSGPVSGGNGGSLNMSASGASAGGSIDTSGGVSGIYDSGGDGGSINLSGGDEDGSDGADGGSISLAGGTDNCNAGSIISNGGIGTGAMGGTLNMSGGVDSDGGSINTSAGSEEYGDGGSINTSGFNGEAGGSINTSAGAYGAGGSINISSGGGSINLYSEYGGSFGGNITSIGVDSYSGGSLLMSGGTAGAGGSINTAGGNEGAGGSINTSNGGGSINTQGVGSIGLGVSGTRTTLNGSATADRTATLPNITGTLPIALISASTALNFGSIGTGGFLDSTITLTGAATTDVVFVTCLNTSGRGATDGKLIFESFVSATNTITVRAHNPTSASIDPASYDFNVCIIKTS